MVAFKDPLSLGSSFVIEIQAHARRIGLERICYKTKIRQVYYCSNHYICHTKAMTTLVEYATRCLYENTNFYSVMIVRSASWLKLKSSHFRKCCEENFNLCVRVMQNHMELFSTTAKLFIPRLRLRVQKAQSLHYWHMGGKILKSVNQHISVRCTRALRWQRHALRWQKILSTQITKTFRDNYDKNIV